MVEGASINKVAVVGATGMLGPPVVIELLRAGFEVTALVRDAEKARRLLPGSTRTVNVDIRDAEGLATAFRGQDAIYLNLSVAPGAKADDFHTEAGGLRNILDAARAAGVKRIAYLSAMIQDWTGRPWWVLDVWRNAIAEIKASGIPYTIFYPTNFMETIPGKHLQGHFLALTGMPRATNYWIAGRDYGMQVANSFRLPEAANREYFIQGPEPMTYDEIGHRFAESYRKRLFVIKLPLVLLKGLGLFSRSVEFNARIMEVVLEYPEEFRAGDAWRELGTPSITIEEFAKGL